MILEKSLISSFLSTKIAGLVIGYTLMESESIFRAVVVVLWLASKLRLGSREWRTFALVNTHLPYNSIMYFTEAL